MLFGFLLLTRSTINWSALRSSSLHIALLSSIDVSATSFSSNFNRDSITLRPYEYRLCDKSMLNAGRQRLSVLILSTASSGNPFTLPTASNTMSSYNFLYLVSSKNIAFNFASFLQPAQNRMFKHFLRDPRIFDMIYQVIHSFPYQNEYFRGRSSVEGIGEPESATLQGIIISKDEVIVEELVKIKV